MRRVVITRTLPDAHATAAHVRARNAVPVIAPMLHILPCAFDTNIDGAQALVFTSSNGVHAFPKGAARASITVFTVGDATAAAARTAGFLDVRSADGDVAALAALIGATLSPARGKLLHIAGEHVAGDLAAMLRGAGFEAERRTAYAARAADVPPDALSQPFDVVLFHSARAAATFRRLAAAQGVAGCFSAKVAEAAGPGWAQVIVAPRPREDALLDAVLGPAHSSAGASA